MNFIGSVRALVFGGALPRVRLHLLLMFFFRKRGNLKMAVWFANRLQRRHGLFISIKSEVPKSLKLKHPVGIVIGDGVKLGENVILYQNVTLGGARMGDYQENNYPEIGDDTVIYAGAVVIGKIKVGQSCVIGANSVVTRDVPDFTTVAGAPARIIKQQST